MNILKAADRGFSKQPIWLSCFFVVCTTHFGFAQTIYVVGNTTVAGLQLVNTNETLQLHQPNTMQENTPTIYIQERTVFYSKEKLNAALVYPKNVNTYNVTFKTNKHKQKLASTKQPTKAVEKSQVATITTLPFSGNYPLVQYNTLASAAVAAPTTPNFYKVLQHRTTVCHYTKQHSLRKVTTKNTFCSYSNPIVAKIITVALSNRPPPFLG